MHERVTRDILNRLQTLEDSSVRFRRGEVTDDSPLSVDLGDSGVPLTGVSTLAGWTPAIGDQVAVLTWGHDLIVLPGEIT